MSASKPDPCRCPDCECAGIARPRFRQCWPCIRGDHDWRFLDVMEAIDHASDVGLSEALRRGIERARWQMSAEGRREARRNEEAVAAYFLPLIRRATEYGVG